GIVDAAGNIQGRTPWYNVPDLGTEMPPLPENGALVALLPGRVGAAVVEVHDEIEPPLEMVLPPAIEASGRVTVGGNPPTDLPAQVRVLAMPEHDDWRLRGLLAVEVTPEPDGTFTLHGLTAGTYRVQAALDNIWLSPSETIEVTSDGVIEPLNLDIGTPAGAVIVEVLNAAGEPVPGAAIRVERPDGPLTDRTWPETFRADGAGRVIIPALEAGTHVI